MDSPLAKRLLAAALLLVLLAPLLCVLRPSLEPTPPAESVAPAPPVPEPVAAPPTPPTPVRFTRPVAVPDAAALDAEAPVDEAQAEPQPAPEVVRIAIEDLTEDELAELHAATMEHIASVLDACDEWLPPGTRVASHVVLDETGLLEMELSSYRDDVEGIEEDLDKPLSEQLVDCVDDTLWAEEWMGSPAGTELPLALTLRIE